MNVRKHKKTMARELNIIKDNIFGEIRKNKDIDLNVYINSNGEFEKNEDSISFNVAEEIVGGILDDGENIKSLMGYLLGRMTRDELKAVTDNINKIRTKDMLLLSASNASDMMIRMIIFGILTSKTEIAKDCLASIIWYIEADLYVSGNLRREIKMNKLDYLEYDNFAFGVAIMYFKQLGFLKQVEFDHTEIEGIDKFIQYKIGNITYREIKELLVTSNYKLPMPIEQDTDDLYTNPNYSWSGFSDKLLEDEDLTEEAKKYIQSIFQRYYSCIHNITIRDVTAVLYGAYNMTHDAFAEETEKKYNILTEKYSGLEVKYKNVRSTLRKTEKAKRNQLEQLSKVRNELATIKKECIALRETSVTLEKYNTDIENSNEKLDKLSESLRDTKRIKNRHEEEIRLLREELDKTKKEKSKLEIEFTSYRENSRTIISNIPLENVVNSIRDAKIAIIGGDTVHNKIKALGLNNLRLLETDRRTVNTNELANLDIVVFMTSYLSHSFMEMPKQFAINNGLNILYFNGRNVDTLCNEIFVALNS